MDLAKLDYWVSCAERIKERAAVHEVPLIVRPMRPTARSPKQSSRASTSSSAISWTTNSVTWRSRGSMFSVPLRLEPLLDAPHATASANEANVESPENRLR
jgi:hypothetical protein